MTEAICLGADDVDLFLAVSHDANPLHRSEPYARRTPFGEPVVYGVLGALAALGRLPGDTGLRPRELKFDFKNPLYVDQRCTVVERPQAPDTLGMRAGVELRDGARTLTRVTMASMSGAERGAPTSGEGGSSRSTPTRVLDPEPGTLVQGTWEPGWSAVARLRDRLGLVALGPAEVAAAAFTSWLVGMEMPGEPALFAKATVSFPPTDAPVQPGPLPFRATVVSFDTRFDLVRVEAVLGDERTPVARFEIHAFVRRPAASVGIAPSLAPGDSWLGRTALVIGASRGLGAALCRALVLQGATVTGAFARSADDAETLQASLVDASGSLRMVQTDVSDERACATLVAAAVGASGLDLLVCNAAPSLRALPLDPGALLRMSTHVERSFRMVAGPVLAARPSLTAARGRAVLVSSSALADPPPDWAHYVAAKGAEEAFLRAAARQHPEIGFLSLRPARLRTDYTLNPHLHDAIWPETVAEALLDRLASAGPTGDLEVLSSPAARV